MQIKNERKIQALAAQGEWFPSDVLLPEWRNLLQRGTAPGTALCYAQATVSDAGQSRMRNENGGMSPVGQLYPVLGGSSSSTQLRETPLPFW